MAEERSDSPRSVENPTPKSAATQETVAQATSTGEELGAMTTALLSQARTAAENLKLTLQAPEELWPQRQEILRRAARVSQKLEEMPEITSTGRRRVLRRVREETRAALWEGLNAQSIDQLQAQGVLSPEEAAETNALYQAAQAIEAAVTEKREAAAEAWAQSSGQAVKPPPYLTRGETVSFLLDAGRQTEAALLQRIYDEIQIKEARIEALLSKKREEVQAAQDQAQKDVTARYEKAAQKLQETLARYAEDLGRIEAVPAVRTRLAEIQAEQERLKELEKAEQALMAQFRDAAKWVAAQHRNAFLAVAEATRDPTIAQKLGQARRGEPPYSSEKQGKHGPEARKLWAETAGAVYEKRVPPHLVQPWQATGSLRDYEANRLLVVGPPARALTQKWLELPEDDPRHAQAKELAVQRERITEDDLILQQLAEARAAYAREAGRKQRAEEQRLRAEAAQKAVAEQAAIETKLAELTRIKGPGEGGFVVEIPVVGRNGGGRPKARGTLHAGLGLTYHVSRGARRQYWRVTELAGSVDGLESGDLLDLTLSQATRGGGRVFKVPDYVRKSADRSEAFIVREVEGTDEKRLPEFVEFRVPAAETAA